MLRGGSSSTRTFACLIVVHLWMTMHPLDLKNLISGPANIRIQHVSIRRWALEPLSTLTVVSGSFEYPNALFDGGTSISLVIWRVDTWQEGDVDTEVVPRELARLTNSLPKCFRRRLRERSEDP